MKVSAGAFRNHTRKHTSDEKIEREHSQLESPEFHEFVKWSLFITFAYVCFYITAWWDAVTQEGSPTVFKVIAMTLIGLSGIIAIKVLFNQFVASSLLVVLQFSPVPISACLCVYSAKKESGVFVVLILTSAEDLAFLIHPYIITKTPFAGRGGARDTTNIITQTPFAGRGGATTTRDTTKYRTTWAHCRNQANIIGEKRISNVEFML